MQLCNARTRSGDACRRFGNVKNGRCHLHGGKSTGPRTDEGRRRIAKAHFKHGRRSKSYLQQRHDLKAELRSIEADLIRTGLLKKDWGQLFNYWGGHPPKMALHPRNSDLAFDGLAGSAFCIFVWPHEWSKRLFYICCNLCTTNVHS